MEGKNEGKMKDIRNKTKWRIIRRQREDKAG